MIRSNQIRKIMHAPTDCRYTVQLSFEEVSLPPFEEILIIGKKCPHGKTGLYHSFELMLPNEFSAFEIEDPIIEAIFVNQRLLKKISLERIVNVLKDKVFPFVSISEVVKVDFKLKVIYDAIVLENIA